MLIDTPISTPVRFSAPPSDHQKLCHGNHTLTKYLLVRNSKQQKTPCDNTYTLLIIAWSLVQVQHGPPDTARAGEKSLAHLLFSGISWGYVLQVYIVTFRDRKT
jgi:hypothetical protein